MERKFICIVCPVGCELSSQVDETGNLLSLSGNRCGRGKKYAEQECKAPMRMLTSTVKIANGLYSRLPVITSESIPKEMVWQVMEELAKVQVKAPVALREVIIKNVCGLQADIVASRSMKAVEL
ncbi:MAG: DUF1667 domain-containing protein [Eubacteriales bacterium]|nr:DUF1667 domain-containing protein [Eubacteriales bacterium]